MPDAISRLNAALDGRYKIQRLLGEGSMANVYLAVDLKPDSAMSGDRAASRASEWVRREIEGTEEAGRSRRSDSAPCHQSCVWLVSDPPGSGGAVVENKGG